MYSQMDQCTESSYVVTASKVAQKRNPFDMSEEQIRKQIYETHHDRSQESLDADSLFIVVGNILTHATQIVDEVMQVQGSTSKLPLEKLEQNINPKANFSVPMCIIKKIGCELLSCKALSAEIAHETTLTILEKLRNYSWEAKAVLTLAAFAKEFGDLLHHVQLDQANNHDQFTKSLSILKGTPIVAKTPELRHKRKEEVIELNNLIKATLNLMNTIFELGKLYIYSPTLDIYWIIMTVVACANKVTILTNDEDKQHDLFPYGRKVHDILSMLARHQTEFRKIKDEEDQYYKLLKLSRSPKEAIKFLKLLFFGQDSDTLQLIDGSRSYKTVEINVLERKKVLLIISQPDISDIDIHILKCIQSEKIEKECIQGQYAIVWVPILLDDDKYKSFKKTEFFESWLRTKEIKWYTISKLVSHTAGRRFLKEEWHLGTNPIAVVMNVAVGKVENRDAFYGIRLWELDAFPFDEDSEQRIFCEMNWIHNLFHDFPHHRYGKLAHWIKKKKYIFFHGGTECWASEIEEKLNFISTELNIKIKRFDLEEKNIDIKRQFWSGVESMVFTKLHKQGYDIKVVKRQIERLSSYKQSQGWFVLNKGATTVIVGSRSTFLKTVDEFNMWKEKVYQRTFEVAFKEYHEKIFLDSSLIQKQSGCCTLKISTVVGKLPEKYKCPVCDQVMEIMTVTYECFSTSKVNTINLLR